MLPLSGVGGRHDPKKELELMANQTISRNNSSITCACTPTQRGMVGAMGGLIAGLVFGMMMNMLNMIGTIAMLVGSKSNAVGWTVHLLISMVIGVAFSIVLEKRLKSYSAGIGYGMAYGIFWWVLGALVLMPLNDTCGISRKIEDPKERSRLRKIIEKISLPEGMGIILRTEASGKRARHIVRDLNILLDEWDQIVAKRDGQNAPVCCFQEPDLVERTVRDFLTEDIDEVACDDAATVERMQRMAAHISGRAKRRINHYQGQSAIFEHYGIQKQIDNAFYRQVWMPCGGYIVIDQTEALVSIDVNTGRNKGHKDVDKLLLETNLEAAAEVARQLRLRNMGGLIVVDFIDMKHRRDQQAVYKLMLDHLKRDQAKTQVLPISQFGLMEMTRQRLNESLGTTLYEPCPYCKGHGQVKTPLTMSVELQRRLVSVLGRAKDDQKSLIVIVHPEVLNRLKTEDGELLVDLERKYQARLTFRSDPAFHREQITLANATTGEEIRP